MGGNGGGSPKEESERGYRRVTKRNEAIDSTPSNIIQFLLASITTTDLVLPTCTIYEIRNTIFYS